MKKPKELFAYGWLDGEYMDYDELEEAYMSMIGALIDCYGLMDETPINERHEYHDEIKNRTRNALNKAGVKL